MILGFIQVDRTVDNTFSSQHSHVELHANQCENRQYETCEYHDIAQTDNRLQQCVNDCFKAFKI